MITIRKWMDLTTAKQNKLFPDYLQDLLDAEFRMLRDHLGAETDLENFDLTQHGDMRIFCREDAALRYRELLKLLPGPSPEFVDVLRLEETVYRAGWLVDNDCCPMAYFVEPWLRESIAWWLQDLAGPYELKDNEKFLTDREYADMGLLTIANGTSPLSMDAGDMTVSRNDLKKHFRDPEVGTKPNPCWHEKDDRTTDAAVEVLGRMWKELESKKNGKGGEEP